MPADQARAVAGRKVKTEVKLMFSLQHGQKVTLRQRLEGNIEGASYEFVVEGVAPDEILLFPVEQQLDISSIFVPGEIVTGFVPGDPPYQFQAVVIRARRIPMPMLMISTPDQVTVVERRRYFRIRVLFDAKVAFVTDEEGSLSEFFPATGLDISSMGVGLHIKPHPRYPVPHPAIHQKVHVVGVLPPVRPEYPKGLEFEARGEIRNIAEMETGWRIGVMFTEVERRTQDLIVAWCFAFQRRIRREGLPLLDGEFAIDEIEAKGAWQQ
jgi:c-di-GMP-binding flagellar brake protein YcgR